MFASSSYAETFDYVSMGLGADFWDKQSNTDELESGSEPGYFGSIALGREINNGFRFEGELSYRRSKVHGINHPDQGLKSSGDGNVLAGIGLFVNGSYEFYRSSMFRPYAMAGIGALQLEVFDDGGANNPINDDKFTYGIQVGAGARYKLNDAIDLSFNARYLKSDSVKLQGLKTEFDTFSLVIGMDYRF